jgi:uncharacterized protein (TIGR00369 family)
MAKVDLAELTALLDREFPQVASFDFRVEQAGERGARVRLPMADRHLRPGGTVSGPAMMTLVDYSFYVAILAELGPRLLAVTTNLSINFLRRPRPVDQVADVRLLKVGRRLAVGDVTVRSDGLDDPVAHAAVTYALPDP